MFHYFSAKIYGYGLNNYGRINLSAYVYLCYLAKVFFTIFNNRAIGIGLCKNVNLDILHLTLSYADIKIT